MSSLDTLFNIVQNDNLASYPFKYCLVDESKHPYNIKGDLAKPNNPEDFSYINEIPLDILQDFKGLGISVIESKVTAIDVDHCFTTPFKLNSITSIGQQILNMFSKLAYIEFSFSGKGMRIFFINPNPIENYQDTYYIKNSNLGIEFYEPYFKARYVTITGKYIVNNPITSISKNAINEFLNNYMIRPKIVKQTSNSILNKEIKTKEEYLLDIKKLYFKNSDFQDIWFKKAPGSNSDESESDYKLMSYLYDYITSDVEMVKTLFMESPFYKSKDNKHINKFTKNDYRYFYYVMSRIIT